MKRALALLAVLWAGVAGAASHNCGVAGHTNPCGFEPICNLSTTLFCEDWEDGDHTGWDPSLSGGCGWNCSNPAGSCSACNLGNGYQSANANTLYTPSGMVSTSPDAQCPNCFTPTQALAAGGVEHPLYVRYYVKFGADLGAPSYLWSWQWTKHFYVLGEVHGPNPWFNWRMVPRANGLNRTRGELMYDTHCLAPNGELSVHCNFWATGLTNMYACEDGTACPAALLGQQCPGGVNGSGQCGPGVAGTDNNEGDWGSLGLTNGATRVPDEHAANFGCSIFGDDQWHRVEWEMECEQSDGTGGLVKMWLDGTLCFSFEGEGSATVDIHPNTINGISNSWGHSLCWTRKCAGGPCAGNACVGDGANAGCTTNQLCDSGTCTFAWAGDQLFSGIWPSGYWGGDPPQQTHPAQHVAFDNLVVSTTPIGASLPTIYFVRTDGSDSACNGLSDQAAPGSPIGTCAFATGPKCSTSMAPGDICQLDSGTFNLAAPGSCTVDCTKPMWNVCDGPNGTDAQHPTIYRGKGTTTKLCNGPSCTANPSRPQFGAWDETLDCSNIVIDSIHTDGGFIVHGKPPATGQPISGNVHDIRVLNSEHEGGAICDGKFSPSRLEYALRVTYYNNKDHGLDTNSGACGDAGTTGLYTRCLTDSILTQNSFLNDGGSGNEVAFGARIAESLVKVEFSKNRVQAGATFNEANSCAAGDTPQIFGNVFEAGALDSVMGVHDGIIRNNTVAGAQANLLVDPLGAAPWTAMIAKDNLVQETTLGASIVGLAAGAMSGHHWNRNFYDASAHWILNGSQPTLTAWKNAVAATGCLFTTGPCEANSQAADVTWATCGAGSDTCYHLLAGSQLANTASTTGGPVGAYGVTSCVGAGCGPGGGSPKPGQQTVSVGLGGHARFQHIVFSGGGG